MPTVKANGITMKFPYTATGKPKADYHAKMLGGKKKNNPGYNEYKS